MTTKTEEILEWLESEAIAEGSLTNWHLSDQFLEFYDTFFHGEDLKKARSKFTRYANMLRDNGIVSEAERVGIGFGGVHEFGCRTQTIWRKIEPREKKEGVTYDKKGRISQIHGRSIYSYSHEELRKMKERGEF